MASRVHIRMTGEDFKALCERLSNDRSNEQFCFALGSRFTRRGTTLILINDLIFPERHELEVQSPGMVCPKREYQSFVYAEAHRRRLSIIDIHTHTHFGKPGFSGIDIREGKNNASYIRTRFPQSVTMGMLVFSSDFRNYSGLLYDRHHDQFRRISAIEVLGNGIGLLDDEASVYKKDERFSRHDLIPGWRQDRLDRLKVAIVGVGGNGAWIVQLAAALGIGRKGWLYLCDPDHVEKSNLPRIPYTTEHDVGRLKVDVAAEYVHTRDPHIHILTNKEPVQSDKVVNRLRFAHLLIGCVDSHGPRKVLNDVSVRYAIPYIDLGSEIFVEDNTCQALAQVRIVLPGATGCLMCCGAIDTVQAKYDLLSDGERQHLYRYGYIHGQDGPPAPSVATLNALTASLGSGILTRLVNGVLPSDREFISAKEGPFNVTAASIPRSETCPVCGIYGVLSKGDLRPERRSKPDFGKARVLGVQGRPFCHSR